MKISGNIPQQLLTCSSALAIILFCLTGVVSMLGWIPDFSEGAMGNALRQEVVVSDGMHVQGECINCGVISATCVLDVADDEHFMAGLVNVSGVLGPGLVEAVSGVSMPPPTAETAADRHYQTTVRFSNGTTRAFAETAESNWQVGERVLVTKGVIQRRR